MMSLHVARRLFTGRQAGRTGQKSRSAIAAGCLGLMAGGLFRRLCKRASGSPHLARWAHAGYRGAGTV